MSIETQEYTIEELEQILAQKKEKEQKAREKAKAEYEAHRDKTIDEIMQEAQRINEQLTFFKSRVHQIMEEQAEKLEAYGAIRGNSKGGFSITNSDATLRVIRRRDTMPTWDERALKGVELVNEFLHTYVKKRNKKIFEMLMSFIEKNKKGDLEYARVMILLQHEDKFDDQRWKEGLALIKEGYMITMKAYGYEFKKVAADGSWQPVQLSFSSI